MRLTEKDIGKRFYWNGWSEDDQGRTQSFILSSLGPRNRIRGTDIGYNGEVKTLENFWANDDGWIPYGEKREVDEMEKIIMKIPICADGKSVIRKLAKLIIKEARRI